MAQSDQLKWNLPGWRMEQRYTRRVLIGNWSEERYSFGKGNYNHASTHCTDYKNNPGFKPDIMTRRAAMLRSDGLDKNLLFSHHKSKHSENLVSWYDGDYNKHSSKDVANPNLRHWDSNRLAWEPEASDHPIKGEPTNFGLAEKLNTKWKRDEAAAGLGEYHTTYGTSFAQLPNDALVRKHYSPSKELSTRMHTANKINKDISLRNVNVIQTPQQVNIPTASRLSAKMAGTHSSIPCVSI